MRGAPIMLVLLTACGARHPAPATDPSAELADQQGHRQLHGQITAFRQAKIVIDAPPPIGVIIYRWITIIDVEPGQGHRLKQIVARHRETPSDPRWTAPNTQVCIEVDAGLLRFADSDGVLSGDVAAFALCPERERPITAPAAATGERASPGDPGEEGGQ